MATFRLIMSMMPLICLAFNPFKVVPHGVKSTSIPYDPAPADVHGGFNALDLLDPRTNKPSFFIEAMAELKQLERAPICHRVAARLLVNSCRSLEGLTEHDLQFNTDAAQRHHVDSFTISLTTCELERIGLSVPKECSPFTSQVLFQHARIGRDNLEVSPTQVNECLRGLAQDTSTLSTFISYRDKALIFCQAARLDLDKDQAIRLNRKLTEIMEDFLSQANGHMESMQYKMAANSDAMDSIFEKIMNDAEVWKNKVQESFELVTNGAKDIDTAMRSILSSGNDANQILKSFIKMIFEGTAAIANEHEKAVEITTNKLESRMVSIHDLVTETESKLGEMRALVMDAVAPMIISLLERQNDLEKKTENVLSAVINATELLQTHNQNLDRATSQSAVISGDLAAAAAAVKTWNEQMNACDSIPDWGIQIISILGSLVVGNIGGSPTLTRNIALLAAGWITGEGIVQVRHFVSTTRILPNVLDCWPWASTVLTPTSPRQYLIPKNYTEDPILDQLDDFDMR